MKRLFFEIIEPPVIRKSGLLRTDCVHGDEGNKSKFPKLRIDGPYGAPAQNYKKYDVLLLIGLGIGATSFINIIKDILNHMKFVEQNRSQPVLTMISNVRILLPRRNGRIMVPHALILYWVTREQGSFDWFKEVMNEFIEMDQKEKIKMHNYLMSVYEEGDSRSIFNYMV
eukprot:Gb_17687 [translate_table: standard]